jgi:hypothetical protein
MTTKAQALLAARHSISSVGGRGLKVICYSVAVAAGVVFA